MRTPKILVVEDSRSIQAIIISQLKKIGADISVADNGKMGLNNALTNSFDLILSDVDMPVMSGLEMCSELKREKKTRGIPVILFSSMESEKDIDRGFEAGAAAYIPKSNTNGQLLSVIDKVLNKTLFQKDRVILVVDDSKTVLRLVENGLARAGFQVMTAPNGKQALHLLKTKRPDLIISDLNMPVMDGFELRDHVRNNPEYNSIPFVIMSANNHRSVMRSMIEKGVAAFLVKPFNIEQLVLTTEKLLSDQFQLILNERERLESERQAMLGSITGLAHALEARDSYTRGHSENVAMLSVQMATLMNFSKDDIESVRIGASLHDLGKVGIPDTLLLKAERLTKTEIKIFQKHPVIGASILKPIPSLEFITPIVLHHHERIDGKGYPQKLKNNQIPIWARIVSVADTYDALTTDRPYRKGFPQEVAQQIIQEVKKTQLCPDCVDALFQWIENT